MVLFSRCSKPEAVKSVKLFGGSIAMLDAFATADESLVIGSLTMS